MYCCACNNHSAAGILCLLITLFWLQYIQHKKQQPFQSSTSVFWFHWCFVSSASSEYLGADNHFGHEKNIFESDPCRPQTRSQSIVWYCLGVCQQICASSSPCACLKRHVNVPTLYICSANPSLKLKNGDIFFTCYTAINNLCSKYTVHFYSPMSLAFAVWQTGSPDFQLFVYSCAKCWIRFKSKTPLAPHPFGPSCTCGLNFS